MLNACNTTTNPGRSAEMNHDIPRENPQKVTTMSQSAGIQSSPQPSPEIRRSVIPSGTVRSSPDTAGKSCLTNVAGPLPLEKPFQLIVFRNDHDTKIKLKEGTILKFPARTFIFDVTKKEVKTPVTLLAREFYKNSDILTAMITTRSEREILETGGMVYLEASAEGKSCIPAPGKSFELRFPYPGDTKGMRLFAGYKDENGKISWKPAATEPSGEIFTVVENQPEYPGGEAALYANFINNIRYPREAKDSGVSGTVFLTFIVEKDGTCPDIRVLRDIGGGCGEEAIRVLKMMPPWNPGKQRGIPVRVQLTLPVRFILDGSWGSAGPAGQANGRLNFHNSTYKPLPRQINQESTYSCILRSGKLGWLNCDRYIIFSNPLITFSIEDDHPEESDMAMIYRNVRVVLTPSWIRNGKFAFPGVPQNEKVTIVATRHSQNRLFLATRETVISASPEPQLDFKEVTEKQYRTAIDGLSR